jgi:hypothetical protein
MDTENPIHINIYKDNKETINSSNNPTESYIIQVNEELNNKNKDLILELEIIKSEKDTIEEDNDKMEKSSTYQRGLLHNLNELNKLENAITSKQKELHKLLFNENEKIEKHIKDFEYDSKLFMCFCGVIILFQCILGIIDIVSSITLISEIGGLLYMSGLHTKIKYGSEPENELKKQTIIEFIEFKNEEIKKIKNSSDFLEDYIDTI